MTISLACSCNDGPGSFALLKQIIEFHGDRIWPASKPELGTTFLFTFLRDQEKLNQDNNSESL